MKDKNTISTASIGNTGRLMNRRSNNSTGTLLPAALLRALISAILETTIRGSFRTSSNRCLVAVMGAAVRRNSAETTTTLRSDFLYRKLTQRINKRLPSTARRYALLYRRALKMDKRLD